MSFPPQGLAPDVLANQATLLANQATLLTRLSAARAEYIDNNYDALHHQTYVFPGDTDLSCTFTAGQAADTWGTWAEIVDSAANTLSSLFTSNPGHLTVIQ